MPVNIGFLKIIRLTYCIFDNNVFIFDPTNNSNMKAGFISKIGDFYLCESQGHGKSVKGLKITSSIQVREPMPGGYLLLRSVKFKVGDKEGRDNAIAIAANYAKEHQGL